MSGPPASAAPVEAARGSEVLVRARAVAVPGRLAAASFELAPGACLALTGPNGAGKSTLLDAVLGLQPFTGALEVRAASLAVVPQRLEVSVAVPLTVADFLGLGRGRWPVALGGAASTRRARAVLAEAGLERLASQPLGSLSGGERRRVLLAAALDRGAALLLLDEPEVGLDATARTWLDAGLARALAAGAAVLLVSHDPVLVARRATATLALEAAGG